MSTGRLFTQMICWCMKAPPSSQTASSIACLADACQQYQAAFGAIARSIAAIVNLR